MQGQDAPHTTFYHYDSKYSRHYPAAGFMYKGIVGRRRGFTAIVKVITSNIYMIVEIESIDTANEKDLIASLTYGRKSGNVIEVFLLFYFISLQGY
jgi:hypothetical protein